MRQVTLADPESGMTPADQRQSAVSVGVMSAVILMAVGLLIIVADLITITMHVVILLENLGLSNRKDKEKTKNSV